jgi:ATP-dependent helicase/nuclease subunit A
VTSATAIAQLLSGRLDIEPDAADPDDGDYTDSSDDEIDDANRATLRHRGRLRTAIGRAVHATLDAVDLTDPPDDAALRRVVEWQCEIEAIGEQADEVAALVRSALASPVVAEAAGSPHHKELFVAAPVGTRVVEGYVDLLIERPDGLVVVDYKTDASTSARHLDEAMARYEHQGAAYAAVLEQVTGRPVVECRFVFCSARGAVERSVADLPAAVERVRSALAERP